jgi:hypothetical protein
MPLPQTQREKCSASKSDHIEADGRDNREL